MQDKAQEFKLDKFGPLPVGSVPVLVQCNGFKGMAFRDREGRWVDLFSHEFLPHVLKVAPT
ncbi:MAG: hypothetical protein WBW41_06395 [Verrucomicrobiia bacterium]